MTKDDTHKAMQNLPRSAKFASQCKIPAKPKLGKWNLISSFSIFITYLPKSSTSEQTKHLPRVWQQQLQQQQQQLPEQQLLERLLKRD